MRRRWSLCDDLRMFSNSARIYDAVYSFKDYGAEAERVHELIQERSPGASSLLDVACGTGKHLEQFRRWYPDVAGVDLDEGLIEIARGRLDDVPLQLADMTSFDLGRKFDAVTCLFSSIGYVGNVERLASAIGAMAAQLTEDGVLVVEPWLTPDLWQVGRPHLLSVDEPDLKIARMAISGSKGALRSWTSPTSSQPPTACSSSRSTTKQPSSPMPSTATHSQPQGSRSNMTSGA